MENIVEKQNEAHSTDTREVAEKSTIEIAGIMPRLLAALIDYLILRTFLSLIGRLWGLFDWGFVVTLVCGALYFALSHSKLGSGQTLGKRCFGIRVLSAKLNTDSMYLSLKAALIRFLVTYGVVIAVVELPILFFRHFEVVTHPMLLEVHMLAVISFVFINAAFMFFGIYHRSVHDRAASSVVVRMHADVTEDRFREFLSSAYSAVAPRGTRREWYAGVGGLMLGIGFWLAGMAIPNQLEAFYAHRYEFEHKFQFRILSVGFRERVMQITGVVLQDSGVIGETEVGAKELTKTTARYLVEKHIVDSASVKQIEYNLIISNPSMEPTELRLSVSTDKFEVTVAEDKVEKKRLVGNG